MSSQNSLKNKEPTPPDTEAADSPSSSIPASSSASVSNMSNTAEADQIAKARNAAAQARHRAKRKVYVTKLESSLASLKETLKQANNEVRIQQLEEENSRLTVELAYLQAHLDGSSSSSDDGQSSVHPAAWPGTMSSLSSASSSQFLTVPNFGLGSTTFNDEDDFDEAVDSREFGLQGWSPKHD
ncbi:hypothetical protein FRB99_005459 [Tulasnella sp. 403]|nr:hypothetical protein FRB99_005459 [Tulasnella sp. 403]